MPTSAPSPLAPTAEVGEHSAVRRVHELATELLEPNAERVDVDGVPVGHVDALRAAGVPGMAGPAEAGGGGVSPAVWREVNEIIAGADGATWFVLTQHSMPLAVVARSRNDVLRERWLGRLCDGRALSGVAVSHLRRPGVPAVRARTTAAGGWTVDGTVGWMTSWGLCDVVLLGAQTDDDSLIFALVDARDQPGMRSTGPMSLAVMGGTGTTTLELDGFAVAPDQVVDVVPRSRWLAADTLKTVNATPAVFGLLRAAVRQLEQTAQRRGEDEGTDLAGRLAQEGGLLRDEAYRLIDHVPAEEAIERRLAARARDGADRAGHHRAGGGGSGRVNGASLPGAAAGP